MNKRLRQRVLDRDRRCVVQRWVPHECRDTMGRQHSSADLERLTMEHVKDADKLMMGKKAPDDEQHLVAVCGYANIELCPRQAVRDREREYLARLYSARNSR